MMVSPATPTTVTTIDKNKAATHGGYIGGFWMYAFCVSVGGFNQLIDYIFVAFTVAIGTLISGFVFKRIAEKISAFESRTAQIL